MPWKGDKSLKQDSKCAVIVNIVVQSQMIQVDQSLSSFIKHPINTLTNTKSASDQQQQNAAHSNGNGNTPAGGALNLEATSFKPKKKTE